MDNMIQKLREQFFENLQSANAAEAFEQLRVQYLGKKGEITGLLKNMASIAPERRKEYGALVNQLKEEAENGIKKRMEEAHARELNARIAATERYDLTLPSTVRQGSYHPITLVQREVEQIFASMGFTIEDYDEIVDDYHCFEALNIPKHHPARDMQDTYYLSNGQLLKTHTSAAQNAIMKKYGAPLRAIFPGRCFRNESTDSRPSRCHSRGQRPEP